MKNPIIVLTGPTASGKTAISFDLAKKFNGEIIAADSMTVYRGMDIGTDKPTLSKKFPPEADQPMSEKVKSKKSGEEIFINGIRHQLLDVLNPDQEFNAAIFKEMVAKIVADIQKRGKVPLLVGGSLLYIDSFVYDFSFPSVEPDEKLRKELEKKSTEELFDELVKMDPDAEWVVDRSNKRRIIRALEIVKKCGKLPEKSKKALPRNVLYLSVEGDREELYDRINKRVDEMMDEGFLDEVKKLFEKYDHNTAMQAAGYKQLIEYLEGKITLPEAVEKTKQVHRNFAKRQLTWLRGNSDVSWIKNGKEAEQKIKDFLKQR